MDKESKDKKSKSKESKDKKTTSQTPTNGITPGKDAFGREVCGEEEPECHESQKQFLEQKQVCESKDSSPFKRGEEDAKKEPKKTFTAVETESGTGHGPGSVTEASRRRWSISPRQRQLIGRWAPTAALYMGTTAVLTVWMTEWKAVLKHVPIIGHKEETEVKKPSTPMGENKHAVLSEGEEAKMRAEEEQKILDNSTIGSPNTNSDENGGAPAPA